MKAIVKRFMITPEGDLATSMVCKFDDNNEMEVNSKLFAVTQDFKEGDEVKVIGSEGKIIALGKFESYDEANDMIFTDTAGVKKSDYFIFKVLGELQENAQNWVKDGEEHEIKLEPIIAIPPSNDIIGQWALIKCPTCGNYH